MKTLWDEAAAPPASDFLAQRVYSSRLIGLDRTLVLHGGGDASVKGEVKDRFGRDRAVIWVKASGYDLATMGAEGFTALDLERTLALGALSELSDADMVAELKIARLNPDAAPPSIEAIVHALVPYKFVDHSHADAMLTISNTPRGGAILREIYGPRVRILPYVKPGFDLALQFRDFRDAGGFDDCEAILLENHGVFTFAPTARESYESMLKIVAVAEDWLARNTKPFTPVKAETPPLVIAAARKAAGVQAKRALLSLPATAMEPEAAAHLAKLTRSGTVAPEHVIHNKPFPASLSREDPAAGLAAFAAEYRAYFERAQDPSLTLPPDFPHWAILSDGAVRSFGPNLKRAQISADVAALTASAIFQAAQLGGWQGLSEPDLRALEYWDLEQAKLKRLPPDPPLAGKVAVAAGAASGIGQATAAMLARKGAAVVGLDVDPGIREAVSAPGYQGHQLDLREEAAVAEALAETVRAFGGIDLLVCNAGIFRTGQTIDVLGDEDWDRTLEINLTAHRKILKQAIPYLKLGFEPGVVFVASRNAPGAGAAADSVSKAGLTQLMRVAALELAPYGITVNAVHPDAVFDTRLWTPEALEASAKGYGLTVEQYKQRNLLKTEIRSEDVARAICAFLDGTLPKTTGAQLPVDGGNDRVL